MKKEIEEKIKKLNEIEIKIKKEKEELYNKLNKFH